LAPAVKETSKAEVYSVKVSNWFPNLSAMIS